MVFFSVIIPIYNSERYLRESIESVINQTCQDFQLILVNDGSTDTSQTICEEYVLRYADKIILINQENKGLLLARREGLKHVSGQFVVWLDSDDKLALTALEEFKQAIVQTSCDLLFFNFSRNEEMDISIAHYTYNNLETFEGERKKEIYHLVCTDLDYSFLWAQVIKYSIIDTQKDYSSYGHFIYLEDLLQLLPILSSAQKIAYLDRCLYFYRDNPLSVIYSDFNRLMFDNEAIVVKKVLYYVKLWGIDNEADCKVFWPINVALWQMNGIRSAATEGYDEDLRTLLYQLSQFVPFQEAYPLIKGNNNIIITWKQRLLLFLLHKKQFGIILAIFKTRQMLKTLNVWH